MLSKIRYILAFNRSGKLNLRGEGLIQVELRQGNMRTYISTHMYAKPENFKNGSFKGTRCDGSYNYAAYKLINEIEDVELDYIKKDIDVTPAMVKAMYKDKLAPSALLSEFGEKAIDDSDRSELTKSNYKTLFNDIEKFRKNVHISDVGYGFIVAYDKYLRGSDGISHNTRVSRLRMLRAVLNEAVNRDIIEKNPFDKFKIQSMEAKKGYVPEEKLEEIEKADVSGHEEISRDAFLVGCYTGLRFSDIKQLRSEHFKGEWIKKTMQKTKLEVCIPYKAIFNGKMDKLLAKYKGNIENLTSKIGDNASVNKDMKAIFKMVGLPETLTFHSSRHTCATLLGFSGVDIQTIQKILGHTKVTTTQIYSEVDEKRMLASIERAKSNQQKEAV